MSKCRVYGGAFKAVWLGISRGGYPMVRARSQFITVQTFRAVRNGCVFRLTPAVNRFPSAGNGLGFKPLADYVHSLGLKFGIHIMRGIPRQAVHADGAILGTETTARGIAHINSICPWNTDMYGVNASKEGAQAYYNSLFQLYAEWGVDFVKVDDRTAICFHWVISGSDRLTVADQTDGHGSPRKNK